MTGDTSGRRCAGLLWTPGGPALAWYGGPGRGERTGPLAGRRDLALLAVGQRGCVGVWRAGRRIPCPTGAIVVATTTGAQCPECRTLDRSMSVAADTRADDQQPYCLYLAWFGPGLCKVGITAAARGHARLLEQGAVAFTMLGRGPLMAARRAEELLGIVLGVRDRVPYAAKRAVRTRLPPVADRFAELAALHERASMLDGWPGSLLRLPFEPVDHSDAFGLDRLAAPSEPEAATAGEVTGLVDGAVVAGELLGAAGPDLHLRSGQRLLIVDTRLLAGWVLRAAGPGPRTSAPVRNTGGPGAGTGTGVQDGLF
ncbi:DUF2797 domain-containing protein [Streptomyces meridianus]|uniref:DUF2797 domain-containing protein n=1 Tax=Streptomyces meridianus TaxID=2938945 RepID=A0ABT0XCB7_9ACTN|nr:DUF2797 domain-containing protein [Streptomyces meridianus]MCM2580156.1 DUF2797 domain-containing protein [Streptomyces meridianus]